MSPSRIAAVVAIDAQRGIGRDGDLPWRLRGDMAHFKRITLEAPEGQRNVVVMGRKTYESIPEKFRPLPGRENLVLSRDPSYAPAGATRVASLRECFQRADDDPALASVFVIGGSSVYAAALDEPQCTTLYITRVDTVMPCDTFFPAFEGSFACVERSEPQREGELSYVFERYERITSPPR